MKSKLVTKSFTRLHPGGVSVDVGVYCQTTYWVVNSWGLCLWWRWFEFFTSAPCIYFLMVKWSKTSLWWRMSLMSVSHWDPSRKKAEVMFSRDSLAVNFQIGYTCLKLCTCSVFNKPMSLLAPNIHRTMPCVLAGCVDDGSRNVSLVGVAYHVSAMNTRFLGGTQTVFTPALCFPELWKRPFFVTRAVSITNRFSVVYSNFALVARR